MDDILEQNREIIDGCDKEMARLFEKRMDAVKRLAAFKREKGLSIDDMAREKVVICRNTAFVKEEYVPYYTDFLQYVMKLSKDMQRRAAEEHI